MSTRIIPLPALQSSCRCKTKLTREILGCLIAVSRSTLSVLSVLNNEQANFLTAESMLEVSRSTHLLTPVASYAASLRLGSVGETPENWHQPGTTTSQLCYWGGDNKEFSPSEHSLVSFPCHCTDYCSHSFILLNSVGSPVFYIRETSDNTLHSTKESLSVWVSTSTPLDSILDVCFWGFTTGTLGCYLVNLC